MNRTRTALAAVVAVVAVLALGACSAGDAAAARAAESASASSAPATSRPWDDAAGVRVVTIGDSITAGHGLTTAEAWPALVAEQEGWQLTDLSCDGAGVAALGDADDCGSAYPALVRRAAGLRPAVVVVQASSNDLGLDTAEVRSATDRVVDDVHRRMPHARLVGLSAIWDQDAPPAQLAVVSAAMRTALRHEGGTFVDIGEPLRGHPTWMQSDDVHPTARGQVAIAAAVRSAFARDDVRF